MRRVRIGMVKAVPAKFDLAANWKIFEELVRAHESDGIDVFITPECFLDGYAVTEKDLTPQRFAEIAQDIDHSAYIRRLRELAAEMHAYIVFGFTERLEEKFWNCALIVGRTGRLEGRYHKTHLQNHDLRFAPGTDLPVFQLDFGTVGIVICADRRWPETIRTLRVKDAELCLIPSYGMWHLDNEWWMRTRAYENEMFVCFSHPNVAFIADPKGQIAAKLQSSVPDVLIHDVDLDAVRSSMLRDRRPDLYSILADASVKLG